MRSIILLGIIRARDILGVPCSEYVRMVDTKMSEDNVRDPETIKHMVLEQNITKPLPEVMKKMTNLEYLQVEFYAHEKLFNLFSGISQQIARESRNSTELAQEPSDAELAQEPSNELVMEIHAGALKGLQSLRGVTHLCLDDNELSVLPRTVEGAGQLVRLEIQRNKLKHDDDIDLSMLSELKWLNIKDNGMERMPGGIADGLEVLNAKCNPFWNDIAKYVFPSSLQSLNLSTCELDSVPEGIYSLGCLKKLKLSGNMISKLDHDGFSQLTSLEELLMYDNVLKELPPSIQELKRLTYINLSTNIGMEALPREILELRSLSRLEINGTVVSGDTVSDVLVDGHPYLLCWTVVSYLPWRGAQGGAEWDSMSAHKICLGVI